MMDFQQIESDIVDFLKSKINLPRVLVKETPDKDEDFEREFATESIIVAFNQEEPLEDLKALGMVYQQTEVTFALLIQSNSLRKTNNKQGVYQLHRLIKKYLIGYLPAGGQPFSYWGFKFIDKPLGCFQYAVYFKTKSMVTQQVDAEGFADTKFKKLTYR